MSQIDGSRFFFFSFDFSWRFESATYSSRSGSKMVPNGDTPWPKNVDRTSRGGSHPEQNMSMNSCCGKTMYSLFRTAQHGYGGKQTFRSTRVYQLYSRSKAYLGFFWNRHDRVSFDAHVVGICSKVQEEHKSFQAATVRITADHISSSELYHTPGVFA